MMGIAEEKFNHKYENYHDFEKEFEVNLSEWEPFFISKAQEDLFNNLKNIFDEKLLNEIKFEGRFYEQVDYVFHFVFKVIGEKNCLEKSIAKLLEEEKNKGDEFSIVINEVELFFRPSYNGKEKNEIWNSMQISEIVWPPIITEN